MAESEHYQEDLSTWISNKLEENKETPDFTVLNMRSSHLLFVYDDLKNGLKYNKKQMREMGGQFISRCFTADANYVMMVYNKKYPIMFSKHVGMPWFPSHISGELWVVPTKVIADQDYFNGLGIKRSVTSVMMEAAGNGLFNSPENKLVVMQGVFFYYGVWNDWKDAVADNSLVQGSMYRRNDESFYYYMWNGEEDFSKKLKNKNQKKAA